MKLGFLKSQEEKIKEWADEKLKEETQKARKELETLIKSVDSNKSTSILSFLALVLLEQVIKRV
jgi:hypothetical protein